MAAMSCDIRKIYGCHRLRTCVELDSMSDNVKHISRLAPSPSGRMHIGNVYAFLVTWAIARQNGMVLKLRMDDLDERCKNKDVQQQLIKDLTWLGIEWDGKVEWQSKRIHLYEEAWTQLNKSNLIYPCFCSRADLHAVSAPHASDGTPIYAGTCRNLNEEEASEKSKAKSPAWRIKVPDEAICFNDEIFGKQVQNLKEESGDFILRRSDGVFAYQFCNAVDDLEMGVTEIVRGCDLMPSVCRELYLVKLIPNPYSLTPNFCHLPMFVNTAHQRLAKRDKSLDLGAMIANGDAPSDIIGKIAHIIGLTDEEVPISSDEFLELFDKKVLRGKTEFVVSYGSHKKAWQP